MAPTPTQTLSDLTDLCVPTATEYKNLGQWIGRTQGPISLRHKGTRREKGGPNDGRDQQRRIKGREADKNRHRASQNRVASTRRQSGKYLSALWRDAVLFFFFLSFLFFSPSRERLTREKQDNHQHFDLSTSLGGFTGFCAH